MLRAIVLLVVVVNLVSLSGTEAEIKVGWIGPLTGNAAVLGVDSLPSIQIAIDELNARGGIHGEEIRIVAEDDQYNTAKTVSAYQHLVGNEGIKVIFMLTYGGIFALADRAQNDGVVLIDTLDCDERIAALPSNIFCIAKSTETLGEAVAQIVLKKNDTPPALIYFDGDPFMGILNESVISNLSKAGITSKEIYTYNDTTSDFRSILIRIARNKEVRSLVLLGYDQLGLAARQARDLGLRLPIYGVNTMTSPGFTILAAGSLEGGRAAAFRAPRTPQYSQFEAQFVSKVGRPPQFETSAIPSYDAMKLLGQALQTQKSALITDKVKAGLLTTKGFVGLSGTITIDSDGATRSIKVSEMVVKGGSLVPAEEN